MTLCCNQKLYTCNEYTERLRQEDKRKGKGREDKREEEKRIKLREV